MFAPIPTFDGSSGCQRYGNPNPTMGSRRAAATVAVTPIATHDRAERSRGAAAVTAVSATCERENRRPTTWLIGCARTIRSLRIGHVAQPRSGEYASDFGTSPA